MADIFAITFIGVCLAVATTLAVSAMLLPWAAKLRLVDFPGGRKDHHAPTPVIGGIAVFLGCVVGILPATLVLPDVPTHLQGFGLAAIIVVLTGMLDDIYDLPWPVRLAAQTLAGVVIVAVGGVRVEHLGPLFGLEDLRLGPLSAPLTVFATVGVINALNMIDGVDGLAGALSACAFLMLLAAAIYAGNLVLASGLAVALGAVAAFLMLNVRLPWQRRARTFLGNSGSALLGLLMAWATFRLTQSPAHPVTPILGPFFVAVPLIDCVVLIARRLRHGRSPFHADRQHIHHLLLDAGLSPSAVVISLAWLALALGFAASAAFRLGAPEPVLVLAFLGLVCAHYWLTSAPGRLPALLAPLTAAQRRETAVLRADP